MVKQHNTPDFRETTRGFTLIELLVVIAIIGILLSTVIAALSTARQKSRDAKRVAEVTQIGRALTLYYDTYQSYPSTTPAGYLGPDAAIEHLVARGFMNELPTPPIGVDATYLYHGIYIDGLGMINECDGAAPAGTVCSSYALGITLERDDHTGLGKDADQAIGTFDGSDTECESGPAGDEACYDIAP
jgi:prepilin-type N-terminal cleavage/methylation domain-containing protein